MVGIAMFSGKLHESYSCNIKCYIYASSIYKTTLWRVTVAKKEYNNIYPNIKICGPRLKCGLYPGPSCSLIGLKLSLTHPSINEGKQVSVENCL